MKPGIASFLLALVGGLWITPPAAAQSAESSQKPAEPEIYPWSETSETVRVPKELLKELTLWSVTTTNFETMQFVLTDNFVQLFGLTSNEVQQVTAKLNGALHEYRTAWGKHLEPTDENVSFGSLQGSAEKMMVEKVNFRLVPFPDDARAVRRKLEDAVLAALGPERAGFFWQDAMVLNTEMKSFDQDSQLAPGTTRSTTYTFVLKHSSPAPGIDLFDTVVTGGPGRGEGRSVGGRPYGQPLDQYAPDKMKPMLARWRQMLAEGAVRSTNSEPEKPNSRVPAAPVPKPGGSTASAGPQPWSGRVSPTRWDHSARYMDLTKDLLKSLRIPGFTDGEISTEAATAFGLTKSDRKAVRDLYDAMKIRFEQVERKHFKRTDPLKSTFVIEAFPEESAALQREWLKKLNDVVGPSRAELLDQSIRTQAPPFRFRNGRVQHLEGRDRRGGPSGPDWLHRGTAETRLDLTIEKGPDGQPAITHYEYQTDSGARGSGGGKPRGNVPLGDQVPEQFRHLITPDVLGLPLAL